MFVDAFCGTGVVGGPRLISGGPWYVQACFMDSQDGREHTLLGMERVIRILK